MGDLPNVHNDNLLGGFDTSDDASVFRVGDNLGLVQSIDFFPPMVDDPFLFGQIAAANSLSDIYAMGGRPSHAMNLLCIPSCLGVEVAGQILAGGADKCVEAGCSIAGGHTINDDEPKYGLSVSGFVSLDRMLANSGARAGDVLLLTGVGAVFPFMRVHNLLEKLQPRIGDIPIVVLYPGAYTGYDIKLFDLLPANPYYRAFNML